jgi:predicted DNA-binding WGR domain protein
MNAVHLRRVDPARNMHHRLDVQPDLFGGVLLIKEWGRIGGRGQIKAERFDDEALPLCSVRPSARSIRAKSRTTPP